MAIAIQRGIAPSLLSTITVDSNSEVLMDGNFFNCRRLSFYFTLCVLIEGIE